MIDEKCRTAMRSVAGTTSERSVITDCNWRGGGPSCRKALLMIVDDDVSNQGRLLTLRDALEAEAVGLPTQAKAGSSSLLVKIAEVLGSYGIGKELPVLFVEEADDGHEALSMFLYDVPSAII